MLKRLIEVALPLKELSEESAHDNRVRSGHIRTLHIWWARRPLVACRAVLFASLIPDPNDPECPKSYIKLVAEVLNRSEFKPSNGDGSAVPDTPRNRCLELLKKLVKWENSNNPEYTEPARQLVAAAYKLFHPSADGDRPVTLDPFAGGGAMPLEALRLGCQSHAVDLNPVAHLIELCALVYPQRYGQPNSRPVPRYILRLAEPRHSVRRSKGQRTLFDSSAPGLDTADDDVPDIEISEEDYKLNPLQSDVLYWGHWVLKRARERLSSYYPEKGKHTALAYLWARTVKCPNPVCGASVPCVHQLWLCNKTKKKIALKLDLQPKKLTISFRIVHGRDIDFDPEEGTMQRGQAACPFCQTVLNSKYLQAEGNAGRIGQRLFAVVESSSNDRTKEYRSSTDVDVSAFEKASTSLDAIATNNQSSPVPNEPLKAWSGVFNAPLFGMTTWGSLLNKRQAYAIAVFAENIKEAHDALSAITDSEYAKAITTYLAFALDKCLDFSSTLCRWGNDDEGVTGTFGRQALPMVWDYAESNPLQSRTGGFSWALGFVADALTEVALSSRAGATVVQGSATALPYESQQFHCVATDPPYYDAVPYSDLSDYFYVWLKRTVGDLYPQLFRTPLTPKTQEVVSHLGNNYPGNRKTPEDYEAGMERAFAEMRRVVDSDGICVVMFAHKTTTAWEKLIAASVNAGLAVSASWPIHTEGRGRLRAHDSAALAGSISLVCRPRPDKAGNGLWDDVRQELKTVAQERLDFFWSHGIRGADFFISAIGPALSVFSKHEHVTKLSGEEVTVGQFLDEVRSFVTSYALAKILKTTHTGTIDPESRFYVVWKWSYADAKVPADESFKLSQALGLNSETLWDKSGVLEKSGENVLTTPVSKRIKIKNLGEPTADGAPASLIDVLHRMCAFREKNDTPGMVEFFGRSGQANNHSLWLVAQAVSEILPDGDKEKQLMQGLLNQRDGLEQAAREKKLF